MTSSMESATAETIRQSEQTTRTGVSTAIAEVTIVAADLSLAGLISAHVTWVGQFSKCKVVSPAGLASVGLDHADAVVYLHSLEKRGRMAPDLKEARKIYRICAEHKMNLFVLVSSAAIYGANFRNPGLLLESYPLPRGNRGIARQWSEFETLARSHFQETDLTILRCPTVLTINSANAIASRLGRRAAVAISGHDPSLQLLSPEDLAEAIVCILRTTVRGTFNVAPDEVMSLRAAMRVGGVRVPVPRTLLRAVHFVRNGRSPAHLDYLRYSWTVSNSKIKKELGFRPRKSSAQALAQFRRSLSSQRNGFQRTSDLRQFDDFGMDKDYIASYGRTLFRFLADWYWRIEVSGIDYIPRDGRAVLTGIHRGFMPWDGVMALHLIAKNTGRYPRFLIHPGLVKFPFLANFMTKLGGIIACQQNAAHVLERDELLGIFPEGIRGAFVPYSQAYQIQEFSRDAFVRIALLHRAPIIPFVTVGSAEIFPILARLQSRRWTRYTEWPYFPLTPTFPFIPLPLPSKWHTRFLPPMHIENEYSPSAARDTNLVRAISREVKERMQQTINEMLQRRRSVFFGSIFSTDVK